MKIWKKLFINLVLVVDSIACHPLLPIPLWTSVKSSNDQVGIFFLFRIHSLLNSQVLLPDYLSVPYLKIVFDKNVEFKIVSANNNIYFEFLITSLSMKLTQSKWTRRTPHSVLWFLVILFRSIMLLPFCFIFSVELWPWAVMHLLMIKSELSQLIGKLENLCGSFAIINWENIRYMHPSRAIGMEFMWNNAIFVSCHSTCMY